MESSSCQSSGESEHAVILCDVGVRNVEKVTASLRNKVFSSNFACTDVVHFDYRKILKQTAVAYSDYRNVDGKQIGVK